MHCADGRSLRQDGRIDGKRMEFRGGQNDEVEDVHAASLEDEGVGTAPQPHAKAEGHHKDSRSGRGCQAHLEGQQTGLNCVIEEQAKAHQEEEHAHTDPDVPLRKQLGEETRPRDDDRAGFAERGAPRRGRRCRVVGNDILDSGFLHRLRLEGRGRDIDVGRGFSRRPRRDNGALEVLRDGAARRFGGLRRKGRGFRLLPKLKIGRHLSRREAESSSSGTSGWAASLRSASILFSRSSMRRFRRSPRSLVLTMIRIGDRTNHKTTKNTSNAITLSPAFVLVWSLKDIVRQK